MISRSPSAEISGSVQSLPARVADGDQPRQQLVEAVEKVAAHGRDHEQRTIWIGQRGGKQAVKAGALGGIGEGEQLLELIDGEQEGGLIVGLAAAQPVGEFQAIAVLKTPSDVAHLQGGLFRLEGARQVLRQHGDRTLADPERRGRLVMTQPAPLPTFQQLLETHDPDPRKPLHPAPRSKPLGTNSRTGQITRYLNRPTHALPTSCWR